MGSKEQPVNASILEAGYAGQSSTGHVGYSCGPGRDESRPPVRWWRCGSLLWPILAVAIGLLMQGVAHFRSPQLPRAPHLAQAVPLTLPGWSSQEVSIGANEFMTGEIGKVLQFDEAVNREYRRQGEVISVYVAYWGAGKMPTQLVASHTPDRCWSENGWRCVDMKFRQPVSFEGVALQPAEWRLFEPPSGDVPLHVMYWHLVEGQAYNYGQRFNRVPDPLRWAKDAVQQALLGNREQYFIRITSNAPFENLWLDPGIGQLLRGLTSLGLRLDQPRVAAAR